MTTPKAADRANVAPLPNPRTRSCAVERSKSYVENYEIGFEQGIEEGKIGESERIKSLHDILMPDHESLFDAFVADGKSTAEDAAVVLLDEQRQHLSIVKKLSTHHHPTRNRTKK